MDVIYKSFGQTLFTPNTKIAAGAISDFRDFSEPLAKDENIVSVMMSLVGEHSTLDISLALTQTKTKYRIYKINHKYRREFA